MHFAGLHADEAATAFRLEGVAPSVKHRKDALMALLRPFGTLEAVDEDDSRKLWRSVRDAAPFCANGSVGEWPLWRVSTTPARGAEFAAKLPPGAQWFYDWAGGLIWIALPPSHNAGAATIRRAAAIDRRPRHARSRARRHARVGRCVRAAAGRARRRQQARQGELRSQGRAQSRPHVGGGVMQTNFSLAQLADPDIAVANEILRACVHCGFCQATCPTYVLLGDELDSPRGRIYLIKEMLEHDRAATEEVVTHIDRCLSCLACMTTCPSGVHYMHLVDHARAHIEETYSGRLLDRLMRLFLAHVMPYPRRLRLAMLAGVLGKPFAPLLAAVGLKPLAAAARLAPLRAPGAMTETGVYPANGPRKARVALLAGCANEALSPSITQATIRVLNRHGVEVVVAPDAGCCGSLEHHIGREAGAFAKARANIDAWTREIEGEGLDAILITISGCGTTVKDYGFMLRTDPVYAAQAAKVSGLARDVSEYLGDARHQAAGEAVRPHGRVPLRLLVAARPARPSGTEGPARGLWFRGERGAGGASVLRLGRHLQHHAAGHRRTAARPQDRQHRQDRA